MKNGDEFMGRIVSVNVGPAVGDKKTPVGRCKVLADAGLEGDAHAGTGRQVSLLAMESIEKMKGKGLEVAPGDFAENFTTEGIDLVSLPVGTRLRVGVDVMLEITQIGKVCHDRCHIFFTIGDCVMPREGVFARVVSGGFAAVGDGIESMP